LFVWPGSIEELLHVKKLTIGDLVVRPSHKGDVLFKVVGVRGGRAILKGVYLRLMADAPLNDLRRVDQREYEEIKKNAERLLRRALTRSTARTAANGRDQGRAQGRDASPRKAKLPGRVLHLDGDREYLDKCMQYYDKIGMRAAGYHVSEDQQPARVTALVEQVRPSVVVLTGHDGFKKGAAQNDIRSYTNSRYFVDAVKNLRRQAPNRDSLVIVAGACQSYYEALMAAGANFASAPDRVNIHMYDPVKVAEAISFTDIGDVARVDAVVAKSITGATGIGGVDTRGTYRNAMPQYA
jgi:spore coat assembly protein